MSASVPAVFGSFRTVSGCDATWPAPVSVMLYVPGGTSSDNRLDPAIANRRVPSGFILKSSAFTGRVRGLTSVDGSPRRSHHTRFSPAFGSLTSSVRTVSPAESLTTILIGESFASFTGDGGVLIENVMGAP